MISISKNVQNYTSNQSWVERSFDQLVGEWVMLSSFKKHKSHYVGWSLKKQISKIVKSIKFTCGSVWVMVAAVVKIWFLFFQKRHPPQASIHVSQNFSLCLLKIKSIRWILLFSNFWSWSLFAQDQKLEDNKKLCKRLIWI